MAHEPRRGLVFEVVAAAKKEAAVDAAQVFLVHEGEKAFLERERIASSRF